MREDATLNSRVHFDKPMLAHHKMKIETLKYICDITGQECEPVGPREHSATLQFLSFPKLAKRFGNAEAD